MKPSETIWTPEQQKAHRKLWVDALRSGKYGQCRDQLIDGNEYCCLGVLADIAGYNWRNWSEMNDQDAPSLAVEFVGLKTSIGYFYEPQDQVLKAQSGRLERCWKIVRRDCEHYRKRASGPLC
jgi:hypothetical protein